MEDGFGNRKPHEVRVSKHRIAQFETIKKLKDMDPQLGKIGIVKILKETGCKISPSTATRLLSLLKNPSQFHD